MMENLLSGFDAVIVLHVLIGLASGVALGLIHFGTLKWNTDLYLGKGMALGLVVQSLRLALLGAAFFGLAWLGAGALLAGAIGLLAVRRVFVRWAGGL